MSSNVIFQNIANVQGWRNKYLRAHGIYDIQNANLHHGDIRPFACPEVVCDVGKTYRSLYYVPSCPCLGFEDGRKVVSGFCGDQYFFLKNGYLHQATEEELCNGQSCRAGTPFQSEAPTVSGGGCNGSCDGIAVSYVVTYVSYLEGGKWVEGAPSPPSTPVATNGNSPNVTVSWKKAPNNYCIQRVRLYRTEAEFADLNPEVQSSEWVLVMEDDVDTRSYTDNLTTSRTGYPLMTYDPMVFPAPNNLVAIAKTEDGIVVADAHRVYISISGEPMFTWDGVVEVDDEIRWLEAIEDTIYVFTDRRPVVIVYKADGRLLTVNRSTINRNLPLTSTRSVSMYRNEVIFASEYSLYGWSRNRYGDNIVSKFTPLLTPEQWKNIDPYSVVGTQYEYGYIFSSDRIDYSLMLEFNDDETDTVIGTSLMPITYINPSAFGIDYEGHIMYNQDGKIWRWDWRRDVCADFWPFDHVRPNVCEQCECCEWSVKFYYDNEGKNHFSHMRIEWDERSAPNLWVSFHIHEFGREIERTDEMEVISSRGFGIPYRNVGYQSCYAHLHGCGIVSQIKVATSANELVFSSTNTVQGEGE